MRKIGIIAIVGALGLMSCTTAGHRGFNSGSSSTSSRFPAIYSEDNAEYKPTSTNDPSREGDYSDKPSKRDRLPVKVMSPAFKDSLVRELEGFQEKGLAKKLAFVAVISVDGRIHLLRADGVNTDIQPQTPGYIKDGKIIDRVTIQRIIPLTIISYERNPDCVEIVYNEVVQGEWRDVYCKKWTD